jgi:chromosome segregation protein
MTMRVTRLELFGFKSFPERTILPLEGGITGVVGPNGCGKSNVVDALRWVLGETRASQLRGGLLEDVIFNGTESLRPLGLAEVTMTLRSEHKGYFGQLTSPSAEAKALAERKTDVGTVKTGEVSNEDSTADSTDISPSGEANVVELVPNEPDHTSLNSRFAWLNEVSEVQVTRRLYRSGESEFFVNKVACRLKDLKDLFRAVGISARSYTIVAQGEVGRIVTSKPADRRIILEEAAGIAGFRDQASEAGRRLGETTQGIVRIDDIVSELSRQVQSLSRQAQRAERRAQIKERVGSLEELTYFHRRTLFEEHKEKFFDRETALQEEEDMLQERYDASIQQESESREKYEAIEQRIDILQRELDDSRAESTRVERERSRVIRELSEAQSVIRSVDQDLERLNSRREVLDQRTASTIQEIAELEENDNDIELKITGVEAETENTLDALTTTLRAKRASLNETERTFRSSREQFIAAQSRLQTVQEQVIALSPLSQLSEGVGLEFAESLKGKVEVLIQALQVPNQHVKAVQSWLNVATQFLIAEDPLAIGEGFLRFLETLPDHQRNEVGVGVLRSGRSRKMGADATSSFVNHSIPFPPLASCISYPEDYEIAVEVLFKQVFFVESSTEALSFLRENGEEVQFDVTLVTSAGEIITPHSFFSRRNEGGCLQLKNQQEVLSQEVHILESKQDDALHECQVLEEQIELLEEEYQEALTEQQAQQQSVRNLGREQGSIKGRLIAVQQLLSQLEQDLSLVKDEITQSTDLRHTSNVRMEEAQEALEMYESHSLHDIEEKIETLRKAIDVALRLRSDLRETFDTLRSDSEKLGTLVDEVRTNRSQHALNARRIEIEFESLKERILEEQGEERLSGLEELFSRIENPEPLPAATLAQIQEDLREQRATLLRIGEVDPTTIETYRVENERLEGFKNQREDLASAAAILSESIQRLTKTSEDKYMTTFESVRQCFSNLIPRLFGGGTGDLALSNPALPLESGVDIFVKPPGKKPKSIDVLSGGEKALCATALIFSLFRQRPSPLCVLDEVDAPLDEANLNRFLDLVRDTCEITQFLLITHNKVSMAASDRLVGVTQVQPGASRLITVSLQEAEKHVA